MKTMTKQEYKSYIIQKASERLSFMNNSYENSEFDTILSSLYESGIRIIKDWHKLKEDDKIYTTDKYIQPLISYVKNGFDEMIQFEKPKLSAESLLKINIGQRLA